MGKTLFGAFPVGDQNTLDDEGSPVWNLVATPTLLQLTQIVGVAPIRNTEPGSLRSHDNVLTTVLRPVFAPGQNETTH